MEKKAPNDRVKHSIIMIGSSGVGKSTILNGLLRAAVFKDGIAKELDLAYHEVHIARGRRYIDTPGLSNIKMRRKAAQEITKALRKEVISEFSLSLH